MHTDRDWLHDKIVNEGLTQGAVATLCGVSRTAVANQVRRHGLAKSRKPVRADGRKYCYRCDSTKKVDQFSSNRSRRDGLQNECKDCVYEMEVVRRYGISAAEYRRLVQLNNGCCHICNGECPTGRRLAADHCHRTGRVRGLLCANCNQGIGQFQDDP